MTSPTSSSEDRPTLELRWLDVGGIRPVLQQKWEISVSSSDPKVAKASEYVWRTVPVVKAKP